MNYYSHHIGDFDRATRHLTRTERSIYLDLIFVYYDTEQPLSKDVGSLCRKIIARTEEEKSAVSAILEEFFVDTPAGWFHERCEEELDAYRKSTSQRSTAGKASAAARAARLQQASNGISTSVERDVEQPSNERSTNHKPITNNQEPLETPPIPPEGGEKAQPKKSKSAITLKTFLQNCKDSNESPIPADNSVFDYAQQAGISSEVLAIQWSEFKARYLLDGAKRYKDWRIVFGKSVRGNWFRLWYIDQAGACLLTTAGQQAKNIADAAKRGTA